MAEPIRAIDLFCGAGGSSWGARLAGVEVVAGFDCWPPAGEAYRRNFPAAKFYGERLEDRDVAKVVEEVGRVDLLIASPECTSHSPARGNRARCEQSRDTAFQVVRFARALRPRWIVIENVVSMRRWARYVEFKAQLALDYHLREQILDSVGFGVAQSRRRLFLFGDRERTPPLVTAPLPVRAYPASQAVQLNGPWPSSPLLTPRRAKPTLARADRAISVLGEKEPFLLVYYGSDGAGGWQRLDRPLRTVTTLDRFALVTPRPEGGHMMRMLQVEELKTAMGMPKAMNLNGAPRREQIRMVGNAVCPPVMRRVIETLTDPCGAEETSLVQPGPVDAAADPSLFNWARQA